MAGCPRLFLSKGLPGQGGDGMDDWLDRIRVSDARARREREQREAATAAKMAKEKEFESAWDSVIRACLAGDQGSSAVPDLSPFVTLAQIIVARGWSEWLDQMAANFSADLDSWLQERRDQLFILGLIREAAKPKANVETLTSVYLERTVGQRSFNWRGAAASEIRDFFRTRIVEWEREVARRAEEHAQKQRADQLERIQLAGRRGMVWRNLQFLRRSRELSGSGNVNEINAQVRDWWNESHPDHRIDRGRKGAEIVRKGIVAAERFLAKHCQGMPFYIDEIISAVNPDGSTD